jgi:osmoprotectant transport system ATP-binding protein
MRGFPLVLEIENISKSFSGKSVLSNVHLKIPSGSTHALIGTSGSGKTTLLRITLGLLPMDQGLIKIDGQALLSFSPRQWSEKIGYVPQEGGLFPHLTGRDNVMLVAKLRGWSADRMKERVEYLSQLVGLDLEILKRFPVEMSGGQKQRVAIMRAGFLDPSVMLLDEPMAALDPMIRRSLQEELKRIFKKLGKTVLLVTHDLSEASFLAENLTLLHEGIVVQSGTYQDLLKRPANGFVTQFVHSYRSLAEFEKVE